MLKSGSHRIRRVERRVAEWLTALEPMRLPVRDSFVDIVDARDLVCLTAVVGNLRRVQYNAVWHLNDWAVRALANSGWACLQRRKASWPGHHAEARSRIEVDGCGEDDCPARVEFDLLGRWR